MVLGNLPDVFAKVSSLGEAAKTVYGTAQGSGQSELDINNTNQPRPSTVISKIAPNLNTSVSATPVKSHVIDTTKANAGGNISSNRTSLMGVKQDAQNVKNSISATIESAQREVIGALKEMGKEYASLFMDRSIAGTGIGLVASAAFGAQSATAFLDLIIQEKKTTPKSWKNMVAEVREKLQEKSVPSSQHSTKGANYMTALAPPGPDNQATFDWSETTDEELIALMFADPDNPSEFFPELRDINALIDTVDTGLEQLLTAENDINKNPAIDLNFAERWHLVDLNANGANFEPPILNTEVAAITQTQPSQNNEPDLNAITPKFGATAMV